MTRALLLGVALGLSLVASHAGASAPDPWFGSDKALHFGVSAALAAGAYAGSSVWLDAHRDRALVGSAVSLSIGAGKELWDLEGHGDPSWRDFAWDAVGTALGVALALVVDARLDPRRESSAPKQQSLLLHF